MEIIDAQSSFTWFPCVGAFHYVFHFHLVKWYHGYGQMHWNRKIANHRSLGPWITLDHFILMSISWDRRRSLSTEMSLSSPDVLALICNFGMYLFRDIINENQSYRGQLLLRNVANAIWRLQLWGEQLNQSPSKCLCHRSSFWRRFVTYAIFWLTKFSRKHFDP